MPLDPIVAAMLEQAAAAGAPPLSEMSPEEGRAMYQAMNAEVSKAPLEEVRDAVADGVPIRIYRPAAGKLPCTVFYHGGGWVIGDLDTHDQPCRLLAQETQSVVIAVDYRLAPEHPFPAPVIDAYKALCWIAEQGETLNIDTTKLAVAGDSAGGNLAAVMALKARDESGPAICHQMLIYPVTDCGMDTPSYTENADGYMLTRASMEWFWGHYADDEARKHPEASPLRVGDLSNLPPATVLTAEFDPLRDEGEAYGEKLKAAGTPVVIKRYDGQVHGFISWTDVLPASKELVSFASEQLKASFK